MPVIDCFRCLVYVDLVNLEQMYTELESNYYDLQKTVDTAISEKNHLTQLLEAERARLDELKVGGVFPSLALD